MVLGALAAQGEGGHKAPSCPLIHGPLRHYILNALWIAVNLVCVFLTLFHLRKLHRDLTKANVEAVRVAGLVTTLVNVTGGGIMGSGTASNANGERVIMKPVIVSVVVCSHHPQTIIMHLENTIIYNRGGVLRFTESLK